MENKPIRVEDEDFGLTTDDLDLEFELEQPKYEVWALGYFHDQITDTEVLLKSFDNPDEAVCYSELVNKQDILRIANKKSVKDVDMFRIEVETVVMTEDGLYENAGTIHYTELLV
jgi:hypothetical protein